MSTPRISDLERGLQEARDALLQRNQEYGELSAKYTGLFDEIHNLRQYLDKIADECQKLKISRRDMLKKASVDRSANAALNEWKIGKDGEISFWKGEYERIRKGADKAKEEIARLGVVNIGYISKIFSLDMELLLAKNPGYTSIPFYYNGVGRSPPIYTKAFYDLFLSCLGVSEEALRNLSLRGLLNCVEPQNRKELGIAFFRGERLRSYRFRTVGENARTLLIGRSYPVFYEHFKKGNVPIGIGLFFIDPENLITDEGQKKEELRNIVRFSRDLLQTVKGTTDELYIFRRAVDEDEDSELSELYPV